MIDIAACLIAVAASVGIDFILLASIGVISGDFKSLINFAQRNPNLQNLNLEELSNRLSELERKLDNMPMRSASGTAYNDTELRKEIEELRTILKSMQVSTVSTPSNVERAYDDTELKRELKDLRELVKTLQDSTISTPSNVERAYDDTELKRELNELRTLVKTAQNSTVSTPLNVERTYDDTELKRELNELRELVKTLQDSTISTQSNVESIYDDTELKKEIVELKQTVQTLQNEKLKNVIEAVYNKNKEYTDRKYSDLENKVNNTKYSSETNETVVKTTAPTVKPNFTPKVTVYTSEKIVTPNEAYVRTLKNNLSSLNGILGKMEFERCEKIFEHILSDGDFDDGEEIMLDIHEAIEKYIYGSDTKVSVSEWEYLEKYIKNAGYSAVPVNAGDDISAFKTYFKQPIPTSGGTKNTIKQIQLQPYVITYEDNGEKETLKLCGKCTYYK